ncbi:hypothetical protein B0H66DRAFT_636481 [Apodospora peruviana]|uniref:Uncharacterized protein n=1 Tax=Apodospora peruviana TaxID=516989 RepID=A0AAE0MA47_9PEZI|nr:hypothetical protein B0H66DRAFT_636481 [Apodospora peruviana]
MQFTKNIVALAAIFSLAIAAPATTAVEQDLSLDLAQQDTPLDLEARAIAGTVSVNTYSGDSCNGDNENVVLTNGGYRCFAVSNKRSIGVSGSGCRVTTWSGNNCRGSSFVAGSGCFSVLYGSVSIQC